MTHQIFPFEFSIMNGHYVTLNIVFQLEEVRARSWVQFCYVHDIGSSLWGQERLSADQYSLGALERIKVVPIKVQETADNVPEKDLSPASSIY